MRLKLGLAGVLVAGGLICAAGGNAAAAETARKPNPLGRSRQLIVVTTASWESVPGQLRRYERSSTGAAWRPIGAAIPVVVGKNGLAWGKGVNAAANDQGPIKKEGDGKAPAGVYRLGRAFGYAPRQDARFVRMSYTHLTSSIECVDDARSRHYNALLDRSRVRRPDWKSSEQMRRSDELYRWGLVVDHNRPKTVAGAGSCIFLHIWENQSTGTAGCTAMKQEDVLEMLRWLNPKAKPLLVQLPEEQHRQLRKRWALP